MTSPTGPVHKYTPPSADIDSFIEPIVVLSGDRLSLEQEQIPDYFWPVSGKWKMRGTYTTTTTILLSLPLKILHKIRSLEFLGSQKRGDFYFSNHMRLGHPI